MSELDRLPALLIAAAALGASACLTHTPGLVVELVLGVTPPPAIADARLTLVELVPCPGTGDSIAHTHEASAPWSMPLGAEDRALLTPRPGRYCDLRLQLEGDALAPRQAVLPLTCGAQRVELTLDHAALGTSPSLLVHAPALRDDGALDEPQHALERLIRGIVVSACD